MAEYRGEIDLKGGGSYNNDYVGVFRVVDGKIALFKEYFNPQILVDSFGGEEGLARTFNLPRGWPTTSSRLTAIGPLARRTSAPRTSCRRETVRADRCGRWEGSTSTGSRVRRKGAGSSVACASCPRGAVATRPSAPPGSRWAARELLR